MDVDSTLTFAARRNIPIRYNRDLVTTTLKAMQRVSEIRSRRERVFYKNRMAGNKERERAANRKLVAENEHLLPKSSVTDKVDEESLGRFAEKVIKSRFAEFSCSAAPARQAAMPPPRYQAA